MSLRELGKRAAYAGAIALAAVSLLVAPVAAQQGNPQWKYKGGPAAKGPAVQPRNFAVQPKGPVGVQRNFVNPGINRAPLARGPIVGFRGPVGTMRFHGYNANFIRGPHNFFRNGRYIPFVGLGVLAAIAVGSMYYAPYAFVDGTPPDACVGPTDDGMCQLQMTQVPLQDGSSALQCVAYCPQQ